MRRRAFITLLGSAAAWPLATRGQQVRKLWRVGFLSAVSRESGSRSYAALQQGMRELGYVEGQSLVVEARWSEGQADRLPALMTEVLQRKVDVLVTWSTPGATVAKNTTKTVPIVAVMGEPVRTGLVNSLSQPGGNVTGLSVGFSEGIAGKWLELLQELSPGLSAVAVTMNPDSSVHRDIAKELRDIAPMRHLKLRIIEVRTRTWR